MNAPAMSPIRPDVLECGPAVRIPAAHLARGSNDGRRAQVVHNRQWLQRALVRVAVSPRARPLTPWAALSNRHRRTELLEPVPRRMAVPPPERNYLDEPGFGWNGTLQQSSFGKETAPGLRTRQVLLTRAPAPPLSSRPSTSSGMSSQPSPPGTSGGLGRARAANVRTALAANGGMQALVFRLRCQTESAGPLVGGIAPERSSSREMFRSDTFHSRDRS